MSFCGRAMLALLVILGVHRAAAKQYTVGGSAGWTIQPNSNSVYDDQFKTINLVVGDSLLFPYTAPNHNVYELSPADASSCSFANPIQTFVTSNPIISLTTSGVHAYACQVPTHCSQLGMVLTVTVAAAAPIAAPSAPPTSAPVAAPVAAPATTPTPAPATTAPTPAPTTKAPAPAPHTPAPSPKHAPSPKTSTPNASPSTGSEPGTGAPAPSPAGSPGSNSGSMIYSGSAMVVAVIFAGFAVLLT